MLCAHGRVNARVHPTSCFSRSSSLRCSAPVAAIPGRSCCFVAIALSRPAARHWVCSNGLTTSLECARKHSFVYLRFFNFKRRQRCDLQRRVLAASTAVGEQYEFRSATSTEDLRDASVLRAEAYYEVLRPTQCLCTQAGLHRQHLQK